MRLISPPSNDDHPPSDVFAGQALVLKLYDALASSKRWAKTLLVITYDEHGGFFDHVPPPLRPARRRPGELQRYGVRVPAIIVSPLVGRRSASHELFDHTSIIKTILLRFARQGNTIPDMGKRVSTPTTLAACSPNPAAAGGNTRALPAARDKITASRKDSTHEQLTLGANTRAAAKTQPTDLQHDYLQLRQAFMKQLLKQAPHLLAKFIP